MSALDIELWKKIKKEKRLTIADIAEKANLPKGSVQNIFCGYVPNPRTDTVEAIEKALGITKDVVDVDISQEEKDFIEVYRQLTQEEKIEFNNIASFILSKRQ